jgi:hypothetical protein
MTIGSAISTPPSDAASGVKQRHATVSEPNRSFSGDESA